MRRGPSGVGSSVYATRSGDRKSFRRRERVTTWPSTRNVCRRVAIRVVVRGPAEARATVRATRKPPTVIATSKSRPAMILASSRCRSSSTRHQSRVRRVGSLTTIHHVFPLRQASNPCLETAGALESVHLTTSSSCRTWRAAGRRSWVSGRSLLRAQRCGGGSREHTHLRPPYRRGRVVLQALARVALE